MTLATEEQKRYIISLIRKTNFRDQTRPRAQLVAEFEERFGVTYEAMSHVQAKQVIEQLKEKSGWTKEKVYGGWRI